MSAHTPGPWTVETVKTSVGHAHKITPTNTCIYVDRRDRRETDSKTVTALANAVLIAAAPDMLEALRAVVRVADRKTVEFDAARAAIAKATGQ